MHLPDPDPSELDPPQEVDELVVHVDGTSAGYAATSDLDGDGVAESVHVGPTVGSSAGGYTYSDLTGDGVADTLTELDADGEVQSQARYDPATGAWVEVDLGAGQEITIDTPDGPVVAGSATVDTDADGVLDTAVAATVDGTTLVVTDSDGDGAADLVTEVAPDGDFTSYAHTGDHEWTATDRGNLAGGSGERDGTGGTAV